MPALRHRILHAVACFLLLGGSALARTPLSFLGEPESLADDKVARQSDLAYRVGVRPTHQAPIVMKLYIHFQPSPAPEDVRMQGRFVLTCIPDDTTLRVVTREKILSHAEVAKLLKCIREQEIFNLSNEAPFLPEEELAERRIYTFDALNWSFERYVPKSPKMHRPQPNYTVVWRTACKSGPVSEVYAAFLKHGRKLLPPEPRKK